MNKLPNPNTARIFAILFSGFSWLFILWLVGLPFYGSRFYVLGALTIFVSLMAVLIYLGFLLKCPHCKKSLAIKTKADSRIVPNLDAARKQFFPIEAILGQSGTVVCPHCGVEVYISAETKGAV